MSGKKEVEIICQMLLKWIFNRENTELVTMELNAHGTGNDRCDSELVIAARSGEDKAFAQLLMRNKDAIYFMLLRLVKNKIDAEELTIEAFGKAFVNIHQYKSQFAFFTWLSSIAFNNAIDHLRRKRVVTVPIEGAIANDKDFEAGFNRSLETSSDNPEEAYIKEQNARLLNQKVASLKPRYKTLLEMRYFKEYSYSEIAAELHIPLESVKVQLFRSRIKLMELLKNSEIDC